MLTCHHGQISRRRGSRPVGHVHSKCLLPLQSSVVTIALPRLSKHLGKSVPRFGVTKQWGKINRRCTRAPKGSSPGVSRSEGLFNILFKTNISSVPHILEDRQNLKFNFNQIPPISKLFKKIPNTIPAAGNQASGILQGQVSFCLFV